MPTMVTRVTAGFHSPCPEGQTLFALGIVSMTEPQDTPLHPQPGCAFSAFIQLRQRAAEQQLMLVPIRHKVYDRQTAFSGGDYDYLLPAAQFQPFLTLLFNLLSQLQVSFSIEQSKAEKLVIHLHAPEEQANITLEIWNQLEVRDPAGATGRQIDFQALQPHLLTQEGFFRLPLELEGLYYLSHLHTKRKRLNLPEVQRRLAHYQQEAAQGEAPRLQRVLEQLQQEGSIASAATAANQQLVALGILAPASTGLSRLRELLVYGIGRWQRQRRKAMAKRRLIAFVGPDGVGKTTLIEQCRELLKSRARYFRFKKMFRASLLYSLLHALRYRALRKAHQGTLPKNEFDELQASRLFWISWLGFPKLWLRSRLQGYQLSDRYYSDFLFRNLRQTEQQPDLIPTWQRLAHHIPQPAWEIQLDAATEVILARKQELSPAAIDLYRQGVFAIYQASPPPFYTYLNTSHTLAQSRDTLRLAAAAMGLPLTEEESSIALQECQPLGEGNERLCYLHPTAANRVLKVTKPSRKSRHQNQIEALYLADLARRGVPFDHIPKLHGWAKTSGGKALVVKRVVNSDGSPLRTLSECLELGLLDAQEARRLLDELYGYLLRYSIIFADVGINNLVCQRREEGWHLMVIDGLGARRLGWKFQLYRKIPLLARSKLRRQWAILLGKLHL